jgi:hypothetical protein
MRRLRAKTAIFRTRARLGVDDGAKVDFVALEFFAKAIRPREQIENIRRVFEVEKRQSLIARDVPAVQNPLPQFSDVRLVACVKHLCRHG